MNNDFFLKKEYEAEIRKINKEISDSFSQKLENLKHSSNLRQSFINYLKIYSDLPDNYFLESPLDQLILLYYAVLIGLKAGSLLLLSYPDFSKQALKDLTFVLKERNLLSSIIDYLVLIKEEKLHEIVNRLKRGASCLEILDEVSETAELKELFDRTDSRFDSYFLKILDYYDSDVPNEESKKAKIIPFKKLEDL